MKSILFILLFIFVHLPALAVTDTLEWEYMGSPGYGYGLNLGINSKGHMFFCGYSSVERSTDDGKTWENILFKYSNGNKIIFDSKDNIYLLYGRKFILFSSNNGNLWDTVHVPFSGVFLILNIFITHTDKLFVFVGTNHYLNILYSDSKGKHWSTIPFLLQAPTPNAFGCHVSSNGDIAVGLGTDAKQRPIYIRSQTDTSWKELVYEISNIGITHFKSAKEFYLISSHGLYYTNSGGDSLKYIDPKGCFEPWYIYTTYFPNDSVIYVGTRSGMAYSSDKGNTWLNLDDKFSEYANPEEPGVTEINVITGDGKDKVYAMPLHGGLFVTSDHGQTWKDIGNKLNSSDIFGATFDKEGNLYVSSRGISKSTDGGRTWQFLGFKEYWDCGQMFCTSKGTLLASTIGGVLRSTDNGQTWTKSKKGLAEGDNSVNIFSRIVENKRGVIFGKYNRYNIVASSFDDGVSWDRHYDSASGTDLAINTDDELFILGDFALIYRSRDEAVSWEQVSPFLPINPIIETNMIFHPKAKTGYAAYYDVLPYNSITTDNGQTWCQISDGDLPPQIMNVFIDSSYKYCFSHLIMDIPDFDIIQRCDENFKNWDTLVCVGLNYPYYSQPIVSPDGYYFIFARYGGLYRSKQKYLSVDNPCIIISDKMEISVFPNPTSTEAEITYTTQTTGRAGLVLYNMLGLPVSIIADSYIEAGRHIARISTTDIPSGAYFLRLECGGESVSAPVWVVR